MSGIAVELIDSSQPFIARRTLSIYFIEEPTRILDQAK